MLRATNTVITTLFLGTSSMIVPAQASVPEDNRIVLEGENHSVHIERVSMMRTVGEQGANLVRIDCLDAAPDDWQSDKPIIATVFPNNVDRLAETFNLMQDFSQESPQMFPKHRHWVLINPEGEIFPVDKYAPFNAMNDFLKDNHEGYGLRGRDVPLRQEVADSLVPYMEKQCLPGM